MSARHHTDGMEPFDRMVYWITERHAIHTKRTAGSPKPWTADPVLQSVFFTNPYRENDKTTVWFRENVRGPLAEKSIVLFATVLFRWFNLSRTGQVLLDNGLYEKWDERKAVEVINAARNGGKDPVFTGGFMIKAGNGPPGCKVPNVCAAVSNFWRERQSLVLLCRQTKSLQAVTKRMAEFPYLGKFMAYEVVTDLRHTFLLRDASDIMTWANPGPGALRGLARMEGRAPGLSPRGKIKRQIKVDDPVGKMRDLMVRLNKVLPKHMPRLEMRDCEHSLCEWDKMERAISILYRGDASEGRLKRKYNGA